MNAITPTAAVTRHAANKWTATTPTGKQHTATSKRAVEEWLAGHTCGQFTPGPGYVDMCGGCGGHQSTHEDPHAQDAPNTPGSGNAA